MIKVTVITLVYSKLSVLPTEDFQGDFMKQCLSITGVSEQYSKYSREKPVTEWRCFLVFPGKSSKIFLNICSIYECFVKCNKNMSNVFNPFVFCLNTLFDSMVVKSYRVSRSLFITD